jgi:hypothetical protein
MDDLTHIGRPHPSSLARLGRQEIGLLVAFLIIAGLVLASAFSLGAVTYAPAGLIFIP